MVKMLWDLLPRICLKYSRKENKVERREIKWDIKCYLLKTSDSTWGFIILFYFLNFHNKFFKRTQMKWKEGLCTKLLTLKIFSIQNQNYDPFRGLIQLSWWSIMATGQKITLFFHLNSPSLWQHSLSYLSIFSILGAQMEEFTSHIKNQIVFWIYRKATWKFLKIPSRANAYSLKNYSALYRLSKLHERQ